MRSVIVLMIGMMSVVGCGKDKDKDNKNPLSSSGIEILEKDRGENVSLRGFVENGIGIEGTILGEMSHAYEFSLGGNKEVDIILDGTKDIVFILYNVSPNGMRFTAVAVNDEDSSSPLSGYSDRSSDSYSLEKGSYLVVIKKYSGGQDVGYELHVNW
jgi:hypothetical protein